MRKNRSRRLQAANTASEIKSKRIFSNLFYKAWLVVTGFYNSLVTLYIVLLLALNSIWKIGKRPKNFRPVPPGKKLKVGIVSEYYFPHLGGLSGDVHYAAVEFAKKGYDVKLITSKVAEPHNLRYSEQGFEIIRLGRSVPIIANGSLAKVSFALNLGSQIKRMMKEQEFDVIHIHCPLTPVLPLMIQRYADCPVVGHVHTFLKTKPIYYSWFEKHLSRFMNDMEGRIAISKVCAKPFSDWFHCDFEILPNGVPIDEFSAHHPKIPRFDDDKVNLFFIGRMEPRNGIATLIDAFRIIHQEEPNTRLILAGAGPLKNYFENTIESSLAPHVHFVGPILEEKPQYFATADINICPTTPVSALGVTLLESMASGKPSVCSDMPAYRETVDPGKDVLMAHPFKPEEFAHQVLRLIGEPGLGAMIAKRAKRKMEEFYSWAYIIDQVDQYTNNILGRLKDEQQKSGTE